MAWEPILWLIFFAMNFALMGLTLYQIVSLSDLEADYLNPYDSSSRINKVVLYEYVLHGAFCILFLVTGHWFMFLLTVVPAYYNAKKFLARQHLIDVTEVFRVVDYEKKIRIVKMAFYLVSLTIVLVRLSTAGGFSTVLSVLKSDSEDLDVRSSVLEF